MHGYMLGPVARCCCPGQGTILCDAGFILVRDERSSGCKVGRAVYICGLR